ncbi:hypothetical protein BV898_07439 [Hypsibius exemplaris]|uniref:Uncharacterized protein n=1 Tax=Hypsibius exemplaris TaxID=2072580 RepID=A0A1W0WT87_HYPEX|nr:hypothetical protein BV898_07439 [Hypsibius exemplaris]
MLLHGTEDRLDEVKTQILSYAETRPDWLMQFFDHIISADSDADDRIFVKILRDLGTANAWGGEHCIGIACRLFKINIWTFSHSHWDTHTNRDQVDNRQKLRMFLLPPFSWTAIDCYREAERVRKGEALKVKLLAMFQAHYSDFKQAPGTLQKRLLVVLYLAQPEKIAAALVGEALRSWCCLRQMENLLHQPDGRAGWSRRDYVKYRLLMLHPAFRDEPAWIFFQTVQLIKEQILNYNMNTVKVADQNDDWLELLASTQPHEMHGERPQPRKHNRKWRKRLRTIPTSKFDPKCTKEDPKLKEKINETESYCLVKLLKAKAARRSTVEGWIAEFGSYLSACIHLGLVEKGAEALHFLEKCAMEGFGDLRLREMVERFKEQGWLEDPDIDGLLETCLREMEGNGDQSARGFLDQHDTFSALCFHSRHGQVGGSSTGPPSNHWRGRSWKELSSEGSGGLAA